MYLHWILESFVEEKKVRIVLKTMSGIHAAKTNEVRATNS